MNRIEAGNQKGIKQLEQYIDQYDKILILDSERIETQELVVRLLEYLPSCIPENQKILVMGDHEVLKNKANGVEVALISHEQMRAFMRLFYLYEFSDRISVVSICGLYPSLFNYLESGILTEEEVFEAMLR